MASSMIKQGLPIVAALLLAGCGGSSTSSSGTSSDPTLQTRQAAAEQTAGNNSLCSAIAPFYWEIGDKTGTLDSGSAGDGSVTASTAMAIASASKWIFSSWVLQHLNTSAQTPLTTDQIQKLNFTSGYENLSTASCLSSADTVDACLTKSGNDTQTTTDIGKFDYNGGHMQQLAHDLGLGGDYINSVATAGNTPKLNADIESDVAALQGQGTNFIYTNALLSGGVYTTAAIYAGFLRAILNDDLIMHDYLDADPVCAWTDNSATCNAVSSPVSPATGPGGTGTVNMHWHYSLGHWIEDDPAAGDGSYSSPGKDGFYPWIDQSKTWYGIIARYQSNLTGEVAVDSVYCGQVIRKAWLTGQAQ